MEAPDAPKPRTATSSPRRRARSHRERQRKQHQLAGMRTALLLLLPAVAQPDLPRPPPKADFGHFQAAGP